MTNNLLANYFVDIWPNLAHWLIGIGNSSFASSSLAKDIFWD
jgi:hypothetical protein